MKKTRFLAWALPLVGSSLMQSTGVAYGAQCLGQAAGAVWCGAPHARMFAPGERSYDGVIFIQNYQCLPGDQEHPHGKWVRSGSPQRAGDCDLRTHADRSVNIGSCDCPANPGPGANPGPDASDYWVNPGPDAGVVE